jgi:hypothetical protein
VERFKSRVLTFCLTLFQACPQLLHGVVCIT